MAGWAFLMASLVGLWFTVQAWRPVQLPKLRAIPSFFAGWLTNELAGHHLAWQLLASAGFIAAGALRTWPGWIALVVVLAQWVMLGMALRDARRAADVVDAAVVDALGPGYRDELPESPESWDALRARGLIVPFRMHHPAVRRSRGTTFARVAATDLRVDVVEPVAEGAGRPAIIYVHGGAWVLGFRDRQGGPLLTEMGARGWVGILPGYRLSPAATFPEHLVDVKRAIAWVRSNAAELGVDPGFIAIAGGSAGGHLAALAALTANDPSYQPGFEDADTSVQACVPFYGAFAVGPDQHDRLTEFERFIARYVLKADPDEDPELWRAFSPVTHLRADAAPFLVIHGARDSLTPAGEARSFATALAEVSRSPVGYAELPGAQHAFDVFPSLRSAHALRGVARFLAVVQARHAEVSARSR